MNDAKVTIITPTCNRLEGLKEAVASVYSQGYQNWEYFIISDGYDEKVKQFVKTLNDVRVKYFFTLKTEYVGNLQRNIALKYALGEYAFFLDDDNIIYKDYIKKMADCFINKDIGYAICQIDYDGMGVLSPQLPFELAKIDTLNFMVRTSLARQVGGWIPFDCYSADFNFISKISKISKGGFVPEVLGWHRTLQTVPSLSLTSNTRKSAPVNQSTVGIIEFLGIKNIIKKILTKFAIPLDRNKSIKVNFNRIIYEILCKTWLKF
jgi:glycosyltransferase involved in cell wall biosynthesis